MPDGPNLETLLDILAEKVAAKVRAELAQAGNGTAIRPRLLSVEQAAAYLGRSSASVRHLINTGTLPTVRLDGRVFLDMQDLDRVIDEAKQK